MFFFFLIALFFTDNSYSSTCEFQEIRNFKTAKFCLQNTKRDFSKSASKKEVIKSTITPSEFHALERYIDPDGMYINKVLWNDLKMNQIEKKRYDLLKSALSKLPSSRRLLNRGTRLSKSLLAQYKKGKTFLWKGFTSTSAFHNLYFVENVHFIIKAYNAKEVWPISIHKEEYEFLLTSFTNFKVLDVNRNEKYTEILVEEILTKNN
ncbi:ADP-ribosyltransferase domain-containing protein [Halobacteriovorax sp. GB3]|uniref:ADP-ribosyltransferase domain-containing protein n=1 Tax=Halobacteriovorax sp. GB3 TaxID=2719615 RepID=UPI0023616666|nr:ADP-ribosyltransferase domain-containing protein [Halobacteriovorax sp. GB3]MDD0854147.1 ADP-ribosyltransferase domain-containing protein [Halobacteriovorax sp. GB3]